MQPLCTSLPCRARLPASLQVGFVLPVYVTGCWEAYLRKGNQEDAAQHEEDTAQHGTDEDPQHAQHLTPQQSHEAASGGSGSSGRGGADGAGHAGGEAARVAPPVLFGGEEGEKALDIAVAVLCVHVPMLIMLASLLALALCLLY